MYSQTVLRTSILTHLKTQACLNFDPRRAAGNQVNLFSCGGRADGGKYTRLPLVHGMSLNCIRYRR